MTAFGGLPAAVAAVAAGAVASAAVAPVSSAAAIAVAATAGHGWDGGGEVGFAFWVDDQVALLAFADGGGFYAFEVFEGEVEHATFAGVGGREAVGLAGLADALCGGFGGGLDLLLAEGLEVEGVEADEIVFADVEAEDLDGDVFEGAEEFATALGEHGRVVAGEVDVDDLGAGVLGVFGGGGGGDAVFQAQSTQADD